MNVVISGASRGIGYELAKKFCGLQDVKVFALARNEQKLLDLKKECDGTQVEVIPIVFDIEKDNFKDVVDKINASASSIDILINNAGLLINKPFEQISIPDAKRMFDVNLFGAMELTKAVIPFLKKAPSPHVVNISSMGGFQGSAKFPGLSYYSASKAAIASITECLAEEYKGEICFNALAIGAVQTEMLSEAFPGYEAPLKAEEMAEFIYSFSRQAHEYLNGKVIPVSLSTP